MPKLLRRTFWFIYKRRWPVHFAKRLGVKVGQECRLINVDYGSEPYLVTLGDRVSATGVNFVTHDGGVWVLRKEFPGLDLIAPIHVGNNVFLGLGVVVLPGVTIGNNVVVGARSVVTKDIPDDCIAAGVPARVIATLEDYRRKVVEQGIETKHFSKPEKRDFLQRHFGIDH